MWGVDHLGVELHAVQPALDILERGHGHRRCLRRDPEALGSLGDRVEMTHPHLLMRGLVGEQHAVAHDVEHRLAVLTLAGVRHLAAELQSQQLRAVTDAEHRDAGVVHRRVDDGRALDVHRLGSTAEDHTGGLLGRDLFRRDRVRHDLAVDVRLAYPTGDQLCVLRAEVDDEDGVELMLGQ